ncbi:MAG TPA: carbonic anhydrase [Phycisphaerae bacterium]|nr:carbonic anhydrase [Phycisphaerae bacterium]
MAAGLFVTVVNCMDGRVQEPVSAWMRRQFNADYVDTITEPGPDGGLASNDPSMVVAIRRRVKASVKAHGSRVVAIVAHHDCAGSPVSREQHLEQLRQSADLVRSWQLPVRVVTLWVNENWQVEPIGDTD